ncbi:MAG TPA: HAD family hydrolase [Longimicrobiales bacterium]|nr:HAD family hydrolase [Longimicrobiales bacterium]
MLFDLDGTLFESRRLYGEAYRRAVLPILERPLTREDLHRISPRSESAFFQAVVPEARRAEAMAAFRREYSALHETGFDGLFDGVEDLLRAVAEAGLRRGVVSGKSRMSWQVTAAHLALVDAFDVVVLDDDVLAPKPDPEGLRLALRELGLEAAEAAYVGDTASDMAAAAAAGIWPILAAWAAGDGPREKRARSAAEHVGADIARSPAAVMNLLLGDG